MEATKSGNSSLTLKAAIVELIRGREVSARLGAALEEVLPTSASRDLIKEISGAFSGALAALDYGARTENFSGRGIRGGTRRKNNNLTRTVVGPTLHDGHLWRKYGQKMILNSEFPRGYYRCIHKRDQKCLATRQVQQSEEDPSLFVITYFGEHTCQISDSLECRPCVLDFGLSSATGSGTLTTGSPSTSGHLPTQEMDMLDESESVQLVMELMGEASGNGDALFIGGPYE